MHAAARYLAPMRALVRPGAIRYCRPGGVNGWERPRAMLRDDPEEAASDAGRWARLIEAVALRRDREAFAALFRYFAPRVKTFMQRSGASEQAADELAQEALLLVW